MTGLDKISEQILSQSKLNCEKIIKKANDEAKSILIQARTTALKKAEEIVRSAEETAKIKNLIAKGNAESITRNRYLDIRNAILNDVLSAAYEEVEKMDDEKYFDMLKKLCLKNVCTGECKMHLNSFDLSRLPSDFEESINSEIYESGAVCVSKEAVDIENGFILNYGDIEINCTLKAVFDEKMDELKDMLNVALFESEAT